MSFSSNISSNSTLFSAGSDASSKVNALRNEGAYRKKPTSVQDVRDAMSEMDRINNTSFAKWIKSENNLNYLCSYKGEMIHEYLQSDADSAMHALEWMVEDWSVESVAELLLKLFYAERINSQLFAKRFHSLTHYWSTERLVEILPILLIGENVAVCCEFYANLYRVSGYATEKMVDLVLPVSYGFKWDADQLENFLLDTVALLVDDSATNRSMMMVIHDEIDTTTNKILMGSTSADILSTFEILYHVVIEERERFVRKSSSLSESTQKTTRQQQEDFMNLEIPFMFDREE